MHMQKRGQKRATGWQELVSEAGSGALQTFSCGCTLEALSGSDALDHSTHISAHQPPVRAILVLLRCIIEANHTFTYACDKYSCKLSPSRIERNRSF